MCDSELPSVCSQKIVKANKQHLCCECKCPISKGKKYQRTNGCWEGKWAEFKTCLPCRDIRDETADSSEGPAPFGYLREHVLETDGCVEYFDNLERQ